MSRWAKGDNLKELCPLCAGVLVVRLNAKTNNLFVGCRSFPACRMNRPLRIGDERDESNPFPVTAKIERRARNFTGTMCAECNQPQFTSPGGVVCTNGHGGADGLDPKTGEVVDPQDWSLEDDEGEGADDATDMHVEPDESMMNIKLTYFKDTGKYYTEGYFSESFGSFESIVQRVDEIHRKGQLPGLREGAGKGFFVLIEPPDDGVAHGVPHLLRPVEESR